MSFCLISFLHFRMKMITEKKKSKDKFFASMKNFSKLEHLLPLLARYGNIRHKGVIDMSFCAYK